MYLEGGEGVHVAAAETLRGTSSAHEDAHGGASAEPGMKTTDESNIQT